MCVYVHLDTGVEDDPQDIAVAPLTCLERNVYLADCRPSGLSSEYLVV